MLLTCAKENKWTEEKNEKTQMSNLEVYYSNNIEEDMDNV